MSHYVIQSNYAVPAPDTSHFHCHHCGSGVWPYPQANDDTIWRCGWCSKVVKIQTLGQELAELIVDRNRQAVCMFWALVAGAALFQSLLPDWVIPECPRQRVEPGVDRWQVSLPTQEDYNARPDDPIPEYSEINELTLHMDVHTFEIKTGTHLDGIFEFGLGFMFLGIALHSRCGQGVVYCWQRDLARE